MRRLIDAENAAAHGHAAKVLAEDFVAITRARGEEQARAALLQEIANPRNPNITRAIEAEPRERVSGDIGMVRSIVRAVDKTQPGATPNRYRNIHVFERRQGDWRCVLWQVTEIKLGEPIG
ncbi:MAG: nuclear transport factor 2 family protein [Gemmatimonadaceae bacterium]